MVLPKPHAVSGQTALVDGWISMPEDHFRWLLMWQADFSRELTLLEVERYGLRHARRTMRRFDARRREFLKSIDQAAKPAGR